MGAYATVVVSVTEDMTARAVGSGEASVLATPTILALAERAAVETLAGRLPAGATTVGTSVKLAHLAPSPVGATVRVTSRVDRVQKRRVVFIFTAWQDDQEIAGGIHVRVVVDRDEFERGAAEKAAGAGEPAAP